MLLIYTHQITARLQYAFKQVFQTLLQFDEYELTADKAVFKDHSGPKFSYTYRAIDDALNIPAEDLLFENDIKETPVRIKKRVDFPILYPIEDGEFPYDLFAATFYLLSRYEEYLPHKRDHYNRFDPKVSIAFEHDFLHLPLVDHWALEWKDFLQARFPELTFPKRKFRFISTIDVDNAFAFRQKGFPRTIGAYLRALIKFDFKGIIQMSRVILGMETDPFDTFDYQMEVNKRHKLETIYFFLLADYGLNDKNVPVQSRDFQQLIQSIADYSKVGIHPSFGSNQKTEKLRVEMDRLNRIVKREVIRSRQHFLKLQLPETYRRLLEQDIQEDYTMGYAAESGFRAGTCTPYTFYDLDEERETSLTIFPFAVMEATFMYYKKTTPDVALAKALELVEAVKAVDGTFISLWHNESLSDQGNWKGWRSVYEEMIESATKA